MRTLCILSLIFSLFQVAPAQDKAHKRGEKKSGTFTLHARKTPYEKSPEIYDAEYVKATASFEFGTRDDVEPLLNDWDICLQGLGTKRSPFSFAARTVTDDESLLWNVGDLPLKEVTRKTHRPHDVKKQQSEDWDWDNQGVRSGHSYVLHTKDENSDLWVAFRVVEIKAGESVKIEWRLLGKPKEPKKKEPARKRRSS